MFCTNCGHKGEGKENFCSHCGHLLGKAEATARTGNNGRKKWSGLLLFLLLGLIIIGGVSFAYSLLTGLTGEEMSPPEVIPDPAFRSPDPQKTLIDPELGGEFASGEILIVAHEGMSWEEVKEIVKEIDGEVVGDMEDLGLFQVDIPGEDIDSIKHAIAVLRDKEEFAAVMPNYVQEPLSSERNIPDVPQWADGNEKKRWGQEVINLPDAWSFTTGGSGVGIGVIDSGFYTEHPDLRGAIFLKMKDPDLEGPREYDYDHHGTAVASIAGALATNNEGMAGVKWEPFLFCYFTHFWTEEAIAVDNAIAREEIRVVNRSMAPIWMGKGNEKWYSDESYKEVKEFWRPLVKKAAENGLLIVQAAGNNPNFDVSMLPLASFALEYDNIIVVSAVDRDLEGIYSSGEAVTVAAPGQTIWSARTEPGFWDGPRKLLFGGPYDYANGTSLAAPFVTGVAGLMLAVDPDLSPAEIKRILMETATTPPGWDNRWGSGIVDAAAAVKMAMEPEEETVEEQLQNHYLINYLGADISEIKEKYGKPEATDYYKGGYNYIYTERAGITFVCSSPEHGEPITSLYYIGDEEILGVKVGMTFAEIKQVLGEPRTLGEPLDDFGEYSFYSLIYMFEDIKVHGEKYNIELWFDAESIDAPINLVWIRYANRRPPTEREDVTIEEAENGADHYLERMAHTVTFYVLFEGISPMEGVPINVIKGENILATIVTDESGKATIDLEDGQYEFISGDLEDLKRLIYGVDVDPSAEIDVGYLKDFLYQSPELSRLIDTFKVDGDDTTVNIFPC